MEYVRRSADRSQPVVRLKSPQELRQAFQESGCSLEIGDCEAGVGTEALLRGLECVLENSVRTSHPLFFNQLYSKADPVAVLGDWCAAATNTNVHTYEVAPCYTVMESEVVSKVARLLGGPYATSHDGLLVPGGSIANLYGMQLARDRIDPNWKTRGMNGGPKLVAFTSSHAHYSYSKSAMLVGLGTDNLVKIGTDEGGGMIPEELEEAVERCEREGMVPFFVGATAGTTVRGGYDDFAAIARICERRRLWMHIDGAWGGSAMLSETHAAAMAGAERADSFCWNPHKMLGATLQCSVFLTRHENKLAECNATSASYLFQPDKLYTEFDLGDKTIQCGRRADCLKLWMMFKHSGDQELARRVDRCHDLADHVQRRVQESGGKFALAFDRRCTNVGFWYVPRSMRPFIFENASEEAKLEISRIAPKIKAEMQRSGDALIGYQPLDGRPNFFRIVFASADDVSFEDIDSMLDRIERIGEEIAPLHL